MRNGTRKATWEFRRRAIASRSKGRAERHPDPVADAFLRRIAAGEVMQAIGRGRGVSRTPDRR